MPPRSTNTPNGRDRADGALDLLADLEAAEQLVALLAALLVQRDLLRQDQAVGLAVDLQDLEAQLAADVRLQLLGDLLGRVARLLVLRPAREVDDLADGHEAADAAVDDQAALVVVDDGRLDDDARVELLLHRAPLALEAGAAERQHRVALVRLRLEHVDEDHVADAQLRLGLGVAAVQLAVADDAFRLGTDVDEDLVLVDAHHGALDHVAVLEAADLACLLVEQLLHRRRLGALVTRGAGWRRGRALPAAGATASRQRGSAASASSRPRPVAASAAAASAAAASASPLGDATSATGSAAAAVATLSVGRGARAASALGDQRGSAAASGSATTARLGASAGRGGSLGQRPPAVAGSAVVGGAGASWAARRSSSAVMSGRARRRRRVATVSAGLVSGEACASSVSSGPPCGSAVKCMLSSDGELLPGNNRARPHARASVLGWCRPCAWWARQTPPFRGRARLCLSPAGPGMSTRQRAHARAVPAPARSGATLGGPCLSCPTWPSSPTRLDAALAGRPVTGARVLQSLVVRGTPAELAALEGQRLRVGRAARQVPGVPASSATGSSSTRCSPAAWAWPRRAPRPWPQTRPACCPGCRAATPARRRGAPAGAPGRVVRRWLPPDDAPVELRYRDADAHGQGLPACRPASARPSPGWDEQGPDADDPALTLDDWRARIRRHSRRAQEPAQEPGLRGRHRQRLRDEILWAARLAPFRKRSSLAADEVDAPVRGDARGPAAGPSPSCARACRRASRSRCATSCTSTARAARPAPAAARTLSEVSPGGFVTDASAGAASADAIAPGSRVRAPI